MKRIVICADGTWNRPEQDLEEDTPTNVLRFARSIKPIDSKGVPQQVFYDWGIGSYHDEKVAGVTGKGIHKNIMDNYRYIVQNYSRMWILNRFGFRVFIPMLEEGMLRIQIARYCLIFR